MTPSASARVPVALIEDDAPFRVYVAGVLAASGRYAVVAQAGSTAEASAWPANVAPALALLDLGLPDAPGTALLPKLAAKFPGLGVIVLTARTDDAAVLDSIRAGAVGYLLKGASSADLLAALDDARAGGAPMSPAIARRVLALMRAAPSPATRSRSEQTGGKLEPLTPREHDVLALVAAGATDKEAAAQLAISVSAVKQHLAHIYAKWRVRSRTEAAIKFTQAR